MLVFVAKDKKINYMIESWVASLVCDSYQCIWVLLSKLDKSSNTLIMVSTSAMMVSAVLGPFELYLAC